MKKIIRQKSSQRFQDKKVGNVLFTWIKYNIGLLGTIRIWEHIEANIVSANLKQVPLYLFGQTGGSLTNIWETRF